MRGEELYASVIKKMCSIFYKTRKEVIYSFFTVFVD